MIKDLESLIQLQDIDLRIYEIIQSQRDLPRLLSELERGVSSAQKAVDNVNVQLAANATEIKSFEEKVNDAKSALEKSQERLNSIKTNREYDAVHAEIENFKSTIAGADARMKNLAAETDKLQQSLEAHKADYEKTIAENDPRIADLKTKIASIDSSVAQLRQNRAAITAGIPKPLLRTYEHILSRRKKRKGVKLRQRESPHLLVVLQGAGDPACQRDPQGNKAAYLPELRRDFCVGRKTTGKS